MNNSSHLGVWSFVFGLFSIVFVANHAYGANELTVERITRITHPAYQFSQNFYGGGGGRYPWSSDNTKILLMERLGTSHPTYSRTGRQWVWADVQALRDACNNNNCMNNPTQADLNQWLTDYEAATSVLPEQPNTHQQSARWSIHPGEEEIIYYTRQTGGTVYLKKYNTTTSVTSTVITLGDLAWERAYIYGWTTSGKLYIANVFDYNPSLCGDDCSEVNNAYIVDTIGTPSKTLITKPNQDCFNMSETEWGYPLWSSHGHSATNPSRTHYAKNYGSGINSLEQGVNVKGECTAVNAWSSPAQHHDADPHAVVHISWTSNDDWFLGSQSSMYWDTQPHLETMKVYQVMYDPTGPSFDYRYLFETVSAGKWKTGTGKQILMLSGLPYAISRKDGSQVLFGSTDGLYSMDDKNNGSVPGGGSWIQDVNWGHAGAFLVDFTTAANPQMACTSFSYSAWGECQSNGTQSRTVASSSPAGCSGGNPQLSQSCTYDTGNTALNILKTNISPVIDGNLGEYASANPVSFSSSAGGNTVTVKSLWNSEAIYIGINVTDSQLNASVITRDGSVWNEDAVEWFIDTNNDGGGQTDPNSTYMLADDYQGIVNILNAQYDTKGTLSGSPSGSWNGSWQSAVQINGTNNNNADSDSGYTVEIRIPWTSIGFSTAPAEATVVGMSFAVDDKDASASSDGMWSNTTGSFQNASNWQKISFSGTTVLVDATPPGPPPILQSN